MTGEQLLQKLQALTPEQRQLEVVVEGDGWLYGASDVRICMEHDGKEDDDKGTPTIVITNNF